MFFRAVKKRDTMKIHLIAIVFFLANAFQAPVSAQQNPHPADTVVLHAKIYTANPQQPWADAVAIRDGKILAIGSDKQIAAYEGSSTKIVDADDHMVLPGFIDTHVHFMAGSARLEEVSLDDAKTVSEFQKMIKDYAAQNPDKKWIQGMGWYYDIFGKSGLPDKKVVDDVISDRPVFLRAYDGHSSLANSEALRLAGITRDTPNPPNGIIVKDPATGEPTGVLKESAGQLVEEFIPKLTRDQQLDLLAKAVHYASSLGLTRVISCGGDAEQVDLFDDVRKRGQLTVRFYMAPFAPTPGIDPQFVHKLEDDRAKYHDDWLDVGAVKFLLDGVIEAHTAAMLEPYANDPSNRGQLYFAPDKYKQGVLELDRLGFQIFTHAIGDRAIRLALDAYEEANKANGHSDARDKIEHIEDPSAQDIPRFGKLGVIASMQPLHATPNHDILDVWAVNVGLQRAQRAWPWHDILAGGAHMSFGSDWPVVTLNPWPGVQILLTRETPEGTPPGGWHPNERITLPQAIKGYTLDAAYAARRDKTEGSIEVGKLADLLIISQNLFKVPPNQIGKTKVMVTIAGGRVVYQDPSWKNGNPAGFD
jgi:predicted amidohydrolase YtcJ